MKKTFLNLTALPDVFKSAVKFFYSFGKRKMDNTNPPQMITNATTIIIIALIDMIILLYALLTLRFSILGARARMQRQQDYQPCPNRKC